MNVITGVFFRGDLSFMVFVYMVCPFGTLVVGKAFLSVAVEISFPRER